MRTCVRLDGDVRLEAVDLSRLPQEIFFSEAPSAMSRKWKRRSLSLVDFIADKSSHEVGTKEGSAWCAGTFKTSRRTSDDAEQVSLVAFDCDRGQPLAEIRATLFVAGYAALVVSSYSHGATRTTVARSKWLDWKEANPNGFAADYMRQRGYHESVAGGAKIASEDNSTIIIDHSPCCRYRVILFPKTPWRRADYRDATTAERAFKNGLRRLANELRLLIDTNCLDVPRLFFDPRCDSKGLKPASYFIGGGCVDLWDPSDEEFSRDDGLAVVSQRADAQQKCFSSFEELKGAVRAVANDDRFLERDDWRNFGAAIHFETDGSAEGLELWQEWCATWTEHRNDPEENERVWRSFRRAK